MQINPQEILDRKIVVAHECTQVQQVGIDLTISEDVVIFHGESLNVLFNETIKLPLNIFALIYQRSSLSRQGIFITTGVYDPNYEGSLGCTIYNMSGEKFAVPKDMRIAQILCFKADAAGAYNGQWQGK